MGRNEKENPNSRLRGARREAQFALSEFASKVGYSRSYLSAVELGHLPETEPVIMAYEATLGLARGSLLEGRQSVARVLHRVSALTTTRQTALPSPTTIALSAGEFIVLPRWQVRQELASLAYEAIEAGVDAGQVFATSLSDADDWSSVDNDDDPLASALHSLLGQGWRIDQLVRTTDDVSRSLALIESRLGLLAASRNFNMLFMPGVAAFPPVSDLFVIEHHCAVMRFDTASTDEQAVMLVKDPVGIRALFESASLIRDRMETLIEAVSFDDRLNFERALERIESQPGDQSLVRGTIALTDFSEARHDDLTALPSGLPVAQDRIDSHVSQSSGLRLTRLVSTLSRHRVRHIYMKSRIEETVDLSRRIAHGMVENDADGIHSPANVERRLRAVLAMLQNYPNFEIALLDDEESSLIQPARGGSVVYWLAQGNEVLLESWPRIGSGPTNHVHITVREPSIAAAFTDHFKNVWSRVAQSNRDREYVIDWFQGQLDRLQR